MPYLIKRTESPAKSLFVLTKTLQPVVNRCLFGCPVTDVLEILASNHVNHQIMLKFYDHNLVKLIIQSQC